MARVDLLVHVAVEVPDDEAMVWEAPESCAPTALRRLLKGLLRDRTSLRHPQEPVLGVIDVAGIKVEWPGDHALRVLRQVREARRNAEEIKVETSQEAPSGRSKACFPWEDGR